MNEDQINVIRELRESISSEQRELIEEALSEEQVAALGSVFSSTDDPKKSEKAINRLKILLKKSPMKLLRLWDYLDEDQQELIKKIIGS